MDDKPLRVLIVDDSEDDTLLLVRELRRGGFRPEFERVETAESMSAALSEQPWDIVLSDYTMPQFRGTQALEMLRETGMDIPFIFVSGTIGEDTAVAAMKVGAHDYLVKSNLKRLVPAIERELRDVEVRRERRRVEEEVQRQQERIRELYEQTKRQAAELERASKAKAEFLSVMSHELITPITAILGYTGMVQDRSLGEINQEQEKTLRKVVKHTKDLLAMINSILETSRMEAGQVRVEIQELNLAEFLDDLKASYDFPLDKDLALVWDYPAGLPAVKSDAAKLRHVLQNLINNAIKYTPKGTVTFSARIKPSASPLPAARSFEIEFRVADTGIGISKDALPFIFEMFQQGRGSKGRHPAGVGLGLHIVKKFTALLGGEIEVGSEEGKGSIFTLTLPGES